MMLHLFEVSTGLLTGRSVSESVDSHAFRARELKAGFGVVSGVVDWEAQRVDLLTGMLVDYIPPSPGQDYEWSPESRRWLIKTEVQDQRAREAAALAAIDRLERSSLRTLRELRIAEIDGAERPEASAARLKQIQQQIEALRQDLSP